MSIRNRKYQAVVLLTLILLLLGGLIFVSGCESGKKTFCNTYTVQYKDCDKDPDCTCTKKAIGGLAWCSECRCTKC